jgi:L,D-peptidoglycan transpeptidase YkuD (ErfK/YbiS/YcfS/YnhG family)
VKSDDLVLTRLGLRFQNHLYPCSIGRSGLSANKSEGDGATPRGVHAITGLLYRPDRVSPPTESARPIRPGDLWSDDPQDPAYNLMVRAPYTPSHERLRRADPLYDLIVLTGWNRPDPVKGHGSAIFVHQWRRPGAPTEGCIGLCRRDLWRIACKLRPQTRLIIR